MFENYAVTNENLETVAKAIQSAFDPCLDFIFKDKSRITNVIPVSYDSQTIYLFAKQITLDLEVHSKIGDITIYKIPHKIQLDDSVHKGWRSTLFKVPELRDLIPEEIRKTYKIPSGGLLHPFTQLQESTPYSTIEGYMATIIHEYAHIYFDSFKLHWQSDKKSNLELFDQAVKYLNESSSDHIKGVRIPSHKHLSEVFAFCTDYTATRELWPQQLDRLQDYYLKLLLKYKEIEESKDFASQDSTLDESPHIFSIIAGLKLVNTNPNDWHQILLNPVLI